MEHHAPHKGAAFEGYYSKFDLPSGAHIALVVCKVHNDKSRPNLLSFTYMPQDASNIYQKEVFPHEMEMRKLSPDNAFEITIPGIGFVRWHGNSTAEYDIKHESFTFQG